MKIENMPKDEKISILKKISEGESKIIEGVLIEQGASNGMIVITENGKYYSDNTLTKELSKDFIDSYPGAVVFMPCNHR